MGHLRGQMGPDLRRQTCCGRCWAPCSRVGGSLGPPQGWWLWRSGDKCTRGGSRVRRVPVTGMSGGRAEAQEVWEAAGVVSLGSTSQPASARWFLHPWVCSQQYLQKYCGLGVNRAECSPHQPHLLDPCPEATVCKMGSGLGGGRLGACPEPVWRL